MIIHEIYFEIRRLMTVHLANIEIKILTYACVQLHAEMWEIQLHSVGDRFQQGPYVRLYEITPEKMSSRCGSLLRNFI